MSFYDICNVRKYWIVLQISFKPYQLAGSMDGPPMKESEAIALKGQWFIGIWAIEAPGDAKPGGGYVGRVCEICEELLNVPGKHNWPVASHVLLDLEVCLQLHATPGFDLAAWLLDSAMDLFLEMQKDANRFNRTDGSCKTMVASCAFSNFASFCIILLSIAICWLLLRLP